MSRKLSEDKQNLIRKRLAQGVRIQDIAEEVQASEKTVKRYKKSLPSVLPETGDSSTKYNYTTLLTKKEELYAKKIEKELLLYEDETEGWVWHVTKGDIRLRQSGMWWNVIVYPESAPYNWIEKLRVLGYRIAISPLHDKDFWSHDSPEYVNPETGEIIEKGKLYKTGDRKKAHWHVIVVTDTRVGYREINDELRNICHCPYIQKCRSLKNSYDYFLHINAPEKYQGYDKDEIQTYNNFHVEPTKYEMAILVSEMVEMIQSHDITEWCDCVEYFKNDPEFTLMLTMRTGYFMGYIKSRYYKQHPNTVKHTEVKCVTSFDFERADDADNDDEVESEDE